MVDNKNDLSRFLMQSTLGASKKTIDHVYRLGKEQWLDQQLQSSVNIKEGYEFKTTEIWNFFRKKLKETHGERAINSDGNDPALPYEWYFQMGWWNQVLSASYDSDSLLRHRIAQALSEVLVVSQNSQLDLESVALANYYDIFYRHAFGSYADIFPILKTSIPIGFQDATRRQVSEAL
ncbi:DUF1800 family protein [Endozoicomonas numazuensis]|uniref:Uncharacterized protein n=1 Tax=Endozoicomonas numazuensis TaxID=1137799 RepID=A0A081NIU4_9GAMM|nr:DUF1800 family protein [Endozoicomonas numazuensis]KEQ18367.1 hypothetical protein GZ78_12740 [Endozoicomonas numazuensis]